MKWQIVQRGTSSQECFGVKNVAAALRQRTGYDPAVVPKEDPSAHAILIGGQEARPTIRYPREELVVG